MDCSPRVVEPTLLIMKYTKNSSLSSMMELKVRFSQFDPTDIEQYQIFYSTNTCRVAFLYKQDANVAYRYAIGSKSVFLNVKFLLKPLESQQQPNSSKADDPQSEYAANRDSLIAESRPVALIAMLQQVASQLKSCLKKPLGGEETSGPNNGGGTTRTAQVRFNMDEVKVST